ncbi:MAG: hypothetical protein Q4A98_11070, partial [Comamonadaceae bacterium]|nr:hypothetical protein [Comamonadaceae bacterium]
RQGMRDGMRPLRLSGALRVADGSTTLEELLATTPEVQWARPLKGMAKDAGKNEAAQPEADQGVSDKELA